jgi:hypothetical protein
MRWLRSRRLACNTGHRSRGREIVHDSSTAKKSAKGTPVNTTAPNPLRLTEIVDTLLPAVSPRVAAAPLAQLAEQLTLNQ